MADEDAYWTGGRVASPDTAAYWVGGRVKPATKPVPVPVVIPFVGGFNPALPRDSALYPPQRWK